MVQFSTDGLIIRDIESGDNDRLLTLLTPMHGRIAVMAKGARSMKSRVMSGTQLFTYSNFDIYERNGFYWVREVGIIDPFLGLTSDISKISLAAYFSEVAYELSGEGEPGSQILKLTLNAFYALSKDKKPPTQIKAAFELRAAGYSGYMPAVGACRVCRAEHSETMFLDVMNGSIVCRECFHGASSARTRSLENEDMREAVIIQPMSPSVTEAVRYILRAEPSKMLAFALAENELRELGRVAESYLLAHLGRGFEALDFYKAVSD